MAGLLSSWWSGKPPEKAEDDTESGEDGGEKKKEESSEDKDSSWVAGLEGIVKNVTDYATTVGETVKAKVQETPVSFVTQFQEEQNKFTREQRRLKDAAVPPWVGYNEEEQMKTQILELSADSRNVLRNPPPGVQFNFDFAKSYPVAKAMLKEDSRLQKLRFDLVPKKVSEQKFWHNYFYRVFLIKQSSQLSSLANAERKDSISSEPATVEGGEEGGEIGDSSEGVDVVQSPGHEEFASDALPTVSAEINRETMQAELGQLGVTSEMGEGGRERGRGEKGGGGEGKGVDSNVWEEQLQQELQDLELQGGEGEGGEEEGEIDTEAWEAELQEMLDTHSSQEQPMQN